MSTGRVQIEFSSNAAQVKAELNSFFADLNRQLSAFTSEIGSVGSKVTNSVKNAADSTRNQLKDTLDKANADQKAAMAETVSAQEVAEKNRRTVIVNSNRAILDDDRQVSAERVKNAKEGVKAAESAADESTSKVKSANDRANQYLFSSNKAFRDLDAKHFKDNGQVVIEEMKRATQQKVLIEDAYRKALRDGDKEAAQFLKGHKEATTSHLNLLKSLSLDKEINSRTLSWKNFGQAVFDAGKMATPMPGVLDSVTSSLGQMGAEGAVAGGAVAAAGLILYGSFKEGIPFDKAKQDLQALTAITDEQKDKLGKSAIELSERWGVDATEGLRSYKLILGALGPDMANSTKELQSMGNTAIIIAKGANSDLVDATRVLTDLLAQYNLDMLPANERAQEFAKISNAIATATREGSAEVPHLVESLKFVGPEAHAAGLSVSETLGLLETLSKGGLRSEQGGTTLRSMLLHLRAGTEEMRNFLVNAMDLTQKDIDPKQVGLIQAFENIRKGFERLRAKPMDDLGLSLAGLGGESPESRVAIAERKLFGTVASQAGRILMDHTDLIQKFTQTIEKGANDGTEATRQAATQMGNWIGQMKIALQILKNTGIDIYTSLKPALEAIAPLIVKLAGVIAWLLKNYFAALAWEINAVISVVKFFIGIIKTAYETLKNFGINAIDWVVQKWDSFTTKVDQVVSFVKMLIGILKDAYNGVMDWGKSFLNLESIISKVAGPVGDIIDKVSSIGGAISDFFGGGDEKKPIGKGGQYGGGGAGGVAPRPFGKGGVLLKPVFSPLLEGGAVAGEAGPEAVIPLNELPNMVANTIKQVVGKDAIETSKDFEDAPPINVIKVGAKKATQDPSEAFEQYKSQLEAQKNRRQEDVASKYDGDPEAETKAKRRQLEIEEAFNVKLLQQAQKLGLNTLEYERGVRESRAQLRDIDMNDELTKNAKRYEKQQDDLKDSYAKNGKSQEEYNQKSKELEIKRLEAQAEILRKYKQNEGDTQKEIRRILEESHNEQLRIEREKGDERLRLQQQKFDLQLEKINDEHEKALKMEKTRYEREVESLRKSIKDKENLKTAEENAEAVHQKNLAEIEKRAQEKRAEQVKVGEQFVHDFFAVGQKQKQKLAGEFASQNILGVEKEYLSQEDIGRKYLKQQLMNLAASKAAEIGVWIAAEWQKTAATEGGVFKRIALFATEIYSSVANAAVSAYNAAINVIEWITAIIPPPWSYALIPAGIAAVYGAYRGAKSLFKFKDGGITQNAQMFSFGAGGEHTGVFGENPSSKGEAFIPLEKLPDVVGRMVVTPQGKLDVMPIVQKLNSLEGALHEVKEAYHSKPPIILDQNKNILSIEQTKREADKAVLN